MAITTATGTATGTTVEVNDIKDIKDIKDLKRAETELEQLVKTDKKRWVEIYELMNRVDKERLYEGSYRSFTQWVNTMADRFKVHVSLLWERKKAGAYYAKIQQKLEELDKEKNIKLKPLDELNITSEQLSLIEKICHGDIKKAAKLINQVDQNRLRRKDLKEAYKTVREQQAAIGKIYKNAHDRDNKIKKDLETKEQEEQEPKVTALDIVLALQANYDWIGTPIEKWKLKVKGKFFSEFGINTGTSKAVRRFDGLYIENITTPADDRGAVCIHGIEIKVDKYDLINDHKMAEYTDFCDYFYLAIPEDLKDIALDLIDKKWGLLIYTTDTNPDGTNYNYMRLERKAERTIAPMREETLARAVIKLM